MSDRQAPVMALRLDAGEGADDAEYHRLAGLLRRELLQTDVSDVRRGSGGPVPAGAKAVDVETLGTLIVSLSTTATALKVVVTTIAGWLDRSRAREVTLEIDGDAITLKGLSQLTQDRLVEDWIARHQAGG